MLCHFILPIGILQKLLTFLIAITWCDNNISRLVITRLFLTEIKIFKNDRGVVSITLFEPKFRFSDGRRQLGILVYPVLQDLQTLRIFQFDTILKLYLGSIVFLLHSWLKNFIFVRVCNWFLIEVYEITWIIIRSTFIEVDTLDFTFFFVVFLTVLRWVEKYGLLRGRNRCLFGCVTVSCMHCPSWWLHYESFRLLNSCLIFLFLKRKKFHCSFEMIRIPDTIVNIILTWFFLTFTRQIDPTKDRRTSSGTTDLTNWWIFVRKLFPWWS